jgi:hypothetical protein
MKHEYDEEEKEERKIRLGDEVDEDENDDFERDSDEVGDEDYQSEEGEEYRSIAKNADDQV